METTLKNKILAGSVLIAVLAMSLFVAFSVNQNKVKGSVTPGGEYVSTSTKDQLGNTMANNVMIGGPCLATVGGCSGILGSVVITGAATGNFCLFDATTSDATKRSNAATTTLACFPASAAAGTYTFDLKYTYGPLLNYTGNVATGTITYRQYGGF